MDRHEIRGAVERVVHDLLRAEHGPGAVIHRKVRSLDVFTAPGPRDYPAGITAARRVADRASGLVREYALGARGAGKAWRDLVEPLGIDPGADDPAVAAFLEISSEPAMPFDPRRCHWTCESCGQWITDTGPYNGNPIDDEEGHAEDCARHLTEIQAWRERVGWEDEGDDNG